MVGYKLGNTLTDFGSVARGVCEVNEDNMLLSVTEHTRIEKRGDKVEDKVLRSADKWYGVTYK